MGPSVYPSQVIFVNTSIIQNAKKSTEFIKKGFIENYKIENKIPHHDGNHE